VGASEATEWRPTRVNLAKDGPYSQQDVAVGTSLSDGVKKVRRDLGKDAFLEVREVRRTLVVCASPSPF